MSVLVILGSARGGGNTAALVDQVLAKCAVTSIDLRTLDIRHYEYGASVERDDFGRVVDAMVEHSHIVLATPVYWYSMSGRMKVFFDRLTDIVTVRKDVGRLLRGRTMLVLASGSEPALPAGFETPFRNTAAYLGMAYAGAFYARANRAGLLPEAAADVARLADEFPRRLDSAVR